MSHHIIVTPPTVVGGSFGYRVKDRKLVIAPGEADTVRYLFRRYLELKSVLALADEFNRERRGLDRATIGEDNDASPAAWTRGKLYYLLSNQLYVGIMHHDQHFEPIMEANQFAAVQALLARQHQRDAPSIILEFKWTRNDGTEKVDPKLPKCRLRRLTPTQFQLQQDKRRKCQHFIERRPTH